MSPDYAQCAQLIRASRALVITAGAGMGVDSGLPDFRGPQGFWRAYPMYRHLGINFYQAANPQHFIQDPAFGWGFYGHRLHLYRQTVPHQGFQLLRDWIQRYDLDYFVVTSNVDGQFQKAGFAATRIYEVHGSILFLQCVIPCSDAIWENQEEIPVDHTTMRATRYPHCPHCGAVARPNILMFGDFSWLSQRSDAQEERYATFVQQHRQDPLVVIEIGAGTAVPTIRYMSEQLGNFDHTRVIRVNPLEAHIHAPHISVAATALQALQSIDALL